MASLALFNRVPGSRAAAAAADTVAQPGDERFLVRSIPNEDLYLFTKDLDNSGVVREADPRTRGAAWRLILSGGAIVTLLIGILLPSAYGRIAGYQIETLKREHARLVNEGAILELKATSILTPARMQILADQQKLVDPGPQDTIYLQTKDQKLAHNGR
jgi:hypothetical protein